MNWRGEEKRAARRRGKKNGTLEIWKRARKSSVQNAREPTVNSQSSGEKTEKKREKMSLLQRSKRHGRELMVVGKYVASS